MAPTLSRIKKMARAHEGWPGNELTDEDINNMFAKNLFTACQQSSYKSYLENISKLLLVTTPPCAIKGACGHRVPANLLPQSTTASEDESFKNGAFYNPMLCLQHARNYCTSRKYLSGDMLKGVAELLLNTHADALTGYSATSILQKCRDLLTINLKHHPPCLRRVREAYDHYLFTPMDPKNYTYSTRQMFGCDKGILKFCFNRLDYEMSHVSPDGPLIDKYNSVPMDMKHPVRDLHWIKQNVFVLELLSRPERIERLTILLGSAVDLLQVDLSIWNTRYINYLPCHKDRVHRPLIATFLWSDELANIGEVNDTCLLVLKLYTNMIHLNYPPENIKVMILWLNLIVQTFYLCGADVNVNFPSFGWHSKQFSTKFYEVIADKPQSTILRVLEHIQPNYMRYLMAMRYVQYLRGTEEQCIITMLLRFLHLSEWHKYKASKREIKQSSTIIENPRRDLNVSDFVTKLCDDLLNDEIHANGPVYNKLPALSQTVYDHTNDLNTVVHAMFIAFQAYMDAFNAIEFLKTWRYLNDNIHNPNAHWCIMEPGLCSINGKRVKFYENVFYAKLGEFSMTYKMLDERKRMPAAMNIFKQNEFLSLL